MEQLQLSIEALLYEQSIEKLKEVCRQLKITTEEDLTKSTTKVKGVSIRTKEILQGQSGSEVFAREF